MRLLLCKRLHSTSIVAGLTLLVLFGTTSAQISITEGGFNVTTLGSSVGAKQIECSPGGVWGDYVYVADSGGNVIERIDYADIGSLFATLSPGAFPVGMAFGPGPGSNFGNFLYVANYGLSTIEKIDPAGTVFPFASVPSPVSNTFDPTGAYGTDMFVVTGYSGPIHKVDEFGVATTFSAIPALYIKFGPGGAWGTGMYSTSQTAVGLVKVDIAGVATNFCTGFTSPEGFDWAFGSPFDGDMFAADVTTGEIWRVKSDGTRTLWATLPSAADVAFCNGSLYVVTFHTGECYKIDPDQPLPVAFSSLQARAIENAVALKWDLVADGPLRGFSVYRRDGDSSDLRPIHGDALLGPDVRSMLDRDVQPGATYHYVVGVVTADGRHINSTSQTVTIPDGAFALGQNYPNPFNPATSIEYTLPTDASVALSIFDSQGRHVVDLERGPQSAGMHTASWDGRNANGEQVASGTYFYKLTAGTYTLTRKLVLIK